MMDLDRRSFLTKVIALLGLAATANVDGLATSAQVESDGTNRIDVHHHFSPPAWIAEVSGRQLLNPANPRWTPEQSIEEPGLFLFAQFMPEFVQRPCRR